MDFESFMMYVHLFFSMVLTRGSGSVVGSPERPRLTDQICEMIINQVTMVMREAILEVLGFTKITIIKMLDECSVVILVAAVTTITTVIAAARHQGGMVEYRDFSNTKPLEFDRFKDPIISMSCLFDVHGCFITCSCLEDQKVKCALNLLRLGA